MTPRSREKTGETAVFRHRWHAWKVVRSITAVRQRPKTPPNWRCFFAFFESFLWHFNKKQRARTIFRLSRLVSCKKQENGSGKQRSLHAPLKGFFSAAYAVSPTCWRSHMKSALTGHCQTIDGAQTAIQRKRFSDLPAASRLRTNVSPRQSTEWRPHDRKGCNHSSSALEKSGKQWRQKKPSFFLRGERWTTTRCRFRWTRMSRNTST